MLQHQKPPLRALQMSPPKLPCTHKPFTLEADTFRPAKFLNSDAVGKLFRNIVRTSEGPLNPATLMLLANYFVTL